MKRYKSKITEREVLKTMGSFKGGFSLEWENAKLNMLKTLINKKNNPDMDEKEKLLIENLKDVVVKKRTYQYCKSTRNYIENLAIAFIGYLRYGKPVTSINRVPVADIEIDRAIMLLKNYYDLHNPIISVFDGTVTFVVKGRKQKTEEFEFANSIMPY